jgi:acetamidase/formamidase
VAVETEDAFSGQVRKEGERRDLAKKPFSNPQSGPIYINNAKQGDTLAIRIESIEPLTGQGATRIVSFWYPAEGDTELLLNFLGLKEIPHGTKVCPIGEGKVSFGNFVLPYQPMIGTIATAHSTETYSTSFPGQYGGNMDLKEITVGATLYLPVWVDGALLHLGDVHAIQGEGELSGAAVEMPSRSVLNIDLIKGRSIDWPRIQNREALYCVAATETGRTLEGAIRLGFMQLMFWLEQDYGLNRWDAFQLLTFVSTISVGNFWTVAVGIPKHFLPEAVGRTRFEDRTR